MFAGIDVGAATAKALIIGDNNKMLSYDIIPTGGYCEAASFNVMERALRKADLSMEDLDYTVSTGYGRYSVPFADEAISEILCHAKGAHLIIPNTRTVIDIGGQDSKVIGMDEEGNVINFNMNDKCAAGTGRFLEVMAKALEVGIDRIGPLSLGSIKPCVISSTCTVFAESEVITYRARKEKVEDIIAGLHEAIAKRVVNMGLRVGYREDILFTGGVAKNVGVHKALEKEIGKKIIIPEEPQSIGALGAALYAKERYEHTITSSEK